MKILLPMILQMFWLLHCQAQLHEAKTLSGTKIRHVTVAFSGLNCESQCPNEALTCDKNLKISYYGGVNSKKQGYYKGRILQTTWDSIQSRFNKFILIGLDSSAVKETDQPFVEFCITTEKGKKYFKADTGIMTESELVILYWFIRLASKPKLLTPADPTIFETQIQFL